MRAHSERSPHLGLFLFRVRSAAIHLVVWTTVLCGALVMPHLGQLVPAAHSTLTIALPPERTSNLAASDAPAIGSRRALAQTPVQTPPHAIEVLEPALVRPAAQTASALRFSWVVLAAIAYIAGVVWLLMRVVVGWIVSARIFRRAAAIDDAPVMARLQECMSAAHLRHRPRLFEAPGLFVPITTGVVNPAILLPTDWRQWHAAKLDAVLVHELSHLARRDTLVQRLSLLYRALYWLSPFGWWLHRHVVALGDCASDEAVLATGIDRAEYAQTLLEFFAAIRDVPRRADWHVAMASGASAERRFNRILRWKERRVSHFTTFATIVIVGALTPVAGLAATASATLVRTELSMLPAPPPRALVASVPTALKFIGAPAASADDTSQEASPIETATQSAPSQPTGASTQPGYVVPRLEPSADRQMVDFVFDLRTLPGEDLKRAATTASVYVDQMWTRADVGLTLSRCGRARTFCDGRNSPGLHVGQGQDPGRPRLGGCARGRRRRHERDQTQERRDDV